MDKHTLPIRIVLYIYWLGWCIKNKLLLLCKLVIGHEHALETIVLLIKYLGDLVTYIIYEKYICNIYIYDDHLNLGFCIRLS